MAPEIIELYITGFWFLLKLLGDKEGPYFILIVFEWLLDAGNTCDSLECNLLIGFPRALVFLNSPIHIDFKIEEFFLKFKLLYSDLITYELWIALNIPRDDLIQTRDEYWNILNESDRIKLM